MQRDDTKLTCIVDVLVSRNLRSVDAAVDSTVDITVAAAVGAVVDTPVDAVVDASVDAVVDRAVGIDEDCMIESDDGASVGCPDMLSLGISTGTGMDVCIKLCAL